MGSGVGSGLGSVGVVGAVGSVAGAEGSVVGAEGCTGSGSAAMTGTTASVSTHASTSSRDKKRLRMVFSSIFSCRVCDGFIIPDGGDFSMVFAAISTFFSFCDAQKSSVPGGTLQVDIIRFT